MTNDSPSDGSLTDDTHLDRVALRVGSLDRVVPFYRDVVGLAVERERDGSRAVLSAGETPVVVLDEDSDAPERGRREAGLFHLAVRVPDRGALGDVLARARTRASDTGATLSGASDHLVSEALYFRDPEGNGVEVYRDRPREEWPWTDDRRVSMDTLPLDLGALADDAAGDEVAPAGTDLGHVHLEVTNVPRSRDFYVDALGMRVRDEGYPGAAFVAAGEYHHHVGLNSWNTRSAPAGGSRGIEWFEIVVPDAATLDAVRESLVDAGHEIEQDGSDESGSGDGDATDAADASTATESLVLSDPDGIGVRVVRSR
ncbi:VOC family protein [Haloferax volcanii]|uniref:Glyoxalase domain protein n=3 Tax=Haloferax volcanii TaxID=2246 RepID=D4GRW6_HALVD|nr:VOC family protein [Haloferax volcanii]ADE02764.1 glyoxalase domain protein [Haloferax volcanii DS2]ELY25737.1 glyoxalase [Haloferax volcanii DS2]MBS8118992.1 VOC family protein [Haloferax volcanii]MBS8124006.1 VOC family protein [Haloferax volcanii]MBS8127875.1 VOC family protein [Haloferax volcanii]